MSLNLAGYQCTLCGVHYDLDDVQYTCPADGGNLDVVLNSTGSFWGKAVTIGKSTAFSAFQEVMALDAASDNSGSAAKARAIWKSAKSGTQINATGYSQ